MLERTTKPGSLENKVENISGNRSGDGFTVGRLTFIRDSGMRSGKRLAFFQCSCGNSVEKIKASVRSGSVKSCGCLKREVSRLNGMKNRKHGAATPSRRAPEYRSWESARSRCRNPSDPSFSSYGGRGIEFSEEWDDFRKFLSNMGERPRGTSLDRIDPNGNYEPGNCRWSEASVQARNRTDSKKHIWRGEEYALPDLAEVTGVPYQRLAERINRRGWSVEKAVSEPPRGWQLRAAE